MHPRVLMVTTAAVTLRAFLLPLARHFRARGWRVDALAAGVGSCSVCHEVFDNCFEAPWSRSLISLVGLPRTERVVRQVVEQAGYNIVHVHTPIAAFATRWALRRRARGTSLIYTAHGFHFHQGGKAMVNSMFRFAERLAARWTDYLVVINQEDCEAARTLRLVPSERLRYMSGIGLDLAQYSCANVVPAEVENIHRSLGLTSGAARLFLMIAEFNPGKRHTDVVKALAMTERPDFHLAFAGVGPEMDRVRSLAQRLGVSHRVHFLGFRSDIPVLLRAATALILPSQREGLPRSIMEAMAMGVPVIGADVRGIRDLIGSGAGILVPVGDATGLASAMQVMADNPQAASTFGKHGVREIQRYGIDTITAAHEELYATALVRSGFPLAHGLRCVSV